MNCPTFSHAIVCFAAEQYFTLKIIGISICKFSLFSIRKAPATGRPDVTFDTDQFRKALGFFATGVTVATGLTHKGVPVGVTVNSFASVSLDPPLILICLATTTGCLEAFCEGGRFAVNVLGEGQRDLSEEFAGPQEHKFKDKQKS